MERAVEELKVLGVRHLRTGISWADFHRPEGRQWYDWQMQALAEFEAQEDDAEAAKARLALADSYLASGQGDLMSHWAEPILHTLDPQTNPEEIARAHFLLSAADLLTGQPLAEAERHLIQATRLAAKNDLPAIAARGQFALGNVLAERGDLNAAVQAFEQSLVLAQAAGDLSLELYGHNNLAYHALLAGDLPTARQQIQIGMEMAQTHALFVQIGRASCRERV